MGTLYEENALRQLKYWQQQMLRKPSFMNRMAKGTQEKLNNIIPEKVHEVITTAIKQMTRGVLFGAEHITRKPLAEGSLEEREKMVRKRIDFYKKTGAAEGGITGFGGILLNFADFPVLLSLKMKLLFDIARLYGYSTKDYKERVYMLYIFQLAFSSHKHRRKVYLKMVNWEEQSRLLPEDIHQLDWRTFQQEYRDYIDLAKLAQLIPFIGAAVGLVANYRLINKLGDTAINAYRMRWEETNRI